LSGAREFLPAVGSHSNCEGVAGSSQNAEEWDRVHNDYVAVDLVAAEDSMLDEAGQTAKAAEGIVEEVAWAVVVEKVPVALDDVDSSQTRAAEPVHRHEGPSACIHR